MSDSSIQDYLATQSEEGKLDSEGGFTLELSKAADKLAAFALPSEAHYLLKLIQVAHRLQAQNIRLKIERFRTVLRFDAPIGGSITSSEAVYQAFGDPLKIEDPLMADLVSGLIGTITDDNLETLWSYSEGHTGQRLFIDKNRRFSVEDFTLSKPKPESEEPFRFSLSILHRKTWKFWQGGRRRALAQKVVEDNCQYSAAQIKIDGREVKTQPASVLNDSQRAMTDGGFYQTIFQPACNICFELAGSEKEAFAILRPSLSAYVVRDKVYNLWSSGTRVYNTMAPDGLSSAAWMLQFLENGKSVSMRFIPKRVHCSTALAYQSGEAGKEKPFKLKIVRQGVTVVEQEMEMAKFSAFRGCHLVLADAAMETDLTGFQVIQNDDFFKRIERTLARLLPRVVEYLEHGETMLTGR